MELVETIAETITKNEVIEAGENIEKSGDIANGILKFADLITTHVWIIPVILVIATIITALIRRNGKK